MHPNFRGRADFTSHTVIIWSSMVLILVSIDKGGPYLYIGSKYRCIRQAFGIENPGKGLQQPTPFGGRVPKYLSRTRVKVILKRYVFIESKLLSKSLMLAFVGQCRVIQSGKNFKESKVKQFLEAYQGDAYSVLKWRNDFRNYYSGI